MGAPPQQFTTHMLLGGRRDAEQHLEVLARALMEKLKNLGSSKELLLSVGLKEPGNVAVFKAVMAIMERTLPEVLLPGAGIPGQDDEE